VVADPPYSSIVAQHDIDLIKQSWEQGKKGRIAFFLSHLSKRKKKKLKQSRNDAYNQIAYKEAYKTSSMGGNQRVVEQKYSPVEMFFYFFSFAFASLFLLSFGLFKSFGPPLPVHIFLFR
jgi:hypothetical protein